VLLIRKTIRKTKNISFIEKRTILSHLEIFFKGLFQNINLRKEIKQGRKELVSSGESM
jgi:hypothetical protein